MMNKQTLGETKVMFCVSEV
uniref:Uncharacterized protein n=1 Tax=Arundo donax TaxID=35708 RepID=A0A0A9FIK0_ARUDO